MSTPLLSAVCRKCDRACAVGVIVKYGMGKSSAVCSECCRQAGYVNGSKCPPLDPAEMTCFLCRRFSDPAHTHIVQLVYLKGRIPVNLLTLLCSAEHFAEHREADDEIMKSVAKLADSGLAPVVTRTVPCPWCKYVMYCSHECLAMHAPEHRKECRG